MSDTSRKFEGLVARPAEGVAGRYYYGLTCIACHKQVAVLNDSSEGALPVTIVGIATIEITCPYCGGASVYPIEDLKPFQQP